MENLTKIDKDLLSEIADLHETPIGAYNIRKNGELVSRSSSANIEIIAKSDKQGIDIKIKLIPYSWIFTCHHLIRVA